MFQPKWSSSGVKNYDWGNCFWKQDMQHNTTWRNTTHHLEHTYALCGLYINNLSNDREDSNFLIHNNF
jgi:hypothetical protein